MTIRDADRIRDKLEVSLDGRQVFFLFFGGAVVACLVFVLGVMVGKRLEGRERLAAKASTSAVIDPLAALDELGADEKLEGEPDELAFPAALAATDKARQRPLGPADVPPAPAPPPKATAPPPAPAKPVTPAAAPPAPAAPPKVAAAAPAKEEKPGPRFTLQISSFQERAEAEALVSKLSGSGYKPFIVMSDVPEKGIFFRVRVGEYPSRDDALLAKDEFEKKQRIIAYVTRI